MGNINENIRGKKLFKEGSSGQKAVKGSDGKITVSREIFNDLQALTDISEVYNDDGLLCFRFYLPLFELSKYH